TARSSWRRGRRSAPAYSLLRRPPAPSAEPKADSVEEFWEGFFCRSSGGWLVSALVGEDAPVDDVGQASLERSAGLGWGLAFAELAQVVAAAGSRVAGLADRDGVQGG